MAARATLPEEFAADFYFARVEAQPLGETF